MKGQVAARDAMGAFTGDKTCGELKRSADTGFGNVNGHHPGNPHGNAQYQKQSSCPVVQAVLQGGFDENAGYQGTHASSSPLEWTAESVTVKRGEVVAEVVER